MHFLRRVRSDFKRHEFAGAATRIGALLLVLLTSFLALLAILTLPLPGLVRRSLALRSVLRCRMWHLLLGSGRPLVRLPPLLLLNPTLLLRWR
jgi:hypothetical protein